MFVIAFSQRVLLDRALGSLGVQSTSRGNQGQYAFMPLWISVDHNLLAIQSWIVHCVICSTWSSILHAMAHEYRSSQFQTDLRSSVLHHVSFLEENYFSIFFFTVDYCNRGSW